MSTREGLRFLLGCETSLRFREEKRENCLQRTRSLTSRRRKSQPKET